MQHPPLPTCEPQRIQALRDTGLLDSPDEERFDRLTRLARQALGVPIALVSLIDTDRQWFKSRQGLATCETRRDVSFCGYAILGDEIFEVPDTLSDIRFSDNPLVTGAPHIRFYAGAPLRTVAGHRIGTLCVISDSPRVLTDCERHILRDLADCVESEINHLDVTRHRKALAMSQQIGQVITQAQSAFIREQDRHLAFDALLNDLLSLTESEYGFVGEILHRSDGQAYLKTFAITNIAWDPETQAFYERHAPEGMEFTNHDTLFGAVMMTGEPVIANDPYHDPRRGGLPHGHPALNAFLGVPVYYDGQILAMFGLANRPGGYDQCLIDQLQPLIATIGQLVHATRIRQLHEQAEAEVARLSRVASETTNGVVVTDQHGLVQWVNAGFTRMTGYSLEEMLGRNPGDVLQRPETDPATIQQMHDALARQEGFEVDVLNFTKAGAPYWLRITCTPLKNEKGLLQGFMAIESDITQQRLAEHELLRFRRTLDQTLDCVYMFDAAELRFFYFNEGAMQQVGYERDELLRMHPYDIKPAYTPEAFRAMIAPLQSGNQASMVFETIHRHRSGQLIPVEIFLQRMALPEEKPHFVAIVRDITERKRIETALAEKVRYKQAIIEHMVDGLIVIDTRGHIESFNPAAERLFGYAAEEVIGQNVSMLMPTLHRQRHDGYLDHYQKTGEAGVIGIGREMEGQHKDGKVFPIAISISEIPHQGQKRYVGLVNDISERKESEARLRHLATHDALTGLPNRTLFLDRLGLDLARAQREGNRVGVLLLDLDNFKVVNDTFGHHHGDTLLVEVATRLSRAMRAGDTLARLGGDEYTAILVDIENEAQVRHTAERLLSALSEPTLINGQEISLAGSIGYCLYPADGLDPETLVRHADSAMYAAKAAGRGTVSGYLSDMDKVSKHHLLLMSRLRHATANGDFELHYQPQVETVTGRIVGAEALLRWTDAELGAVPPDRFIPVAEASGLILPIGEWVLETACRQIAAWQGQGLDLPVAINLSPYQFRQPDLVQKIQAACQRHGCPVNRLELEITETTAMLSPELTQCQVTALADAGFSLALDDFGTGYSSLSRLGQWRVHKLKIDRSFIAQTPGNAMYETLVRTTIRLGQEMGMSLLAEGVETEAQRSFLAEHGCNTYQGWLFSKALPAEAFEHLLIHSRQKAVAKLPIAACALQFDLKSSELNSDAQEREGQP